MTFSEVFLLHFRYTEAVFNKEFIDVCNRLISRCLVDIASEVNYACYLLKSSMYGVFCNLITVLAQFSS